MPYVEASPRRNPEIEYTATANNRLVPDSDLYLGSDWLAGYRQARILEALRERRNWDMAGIQTLQMDKVSIPWREMRESLLAMLGEIEDIRPAMELLRDWDGVIHEESPAATVYEFFIAEMARRMAQAKALHSMDWTLDQGFNPLVLSSAFNLNHLGQLVTLLRKQPGGWFTRSWPAEIADALAAVIQKLREARGPALDRWAWERVRLLTLTHPIGVRKPLNRIFNLGANALGWRWAHNKCGLRGAIQPYLKSWCFTAHGREYRQLG